MKMKKSKWWLILGIWFWILAAIALMTGLAYPNHWLLWVETAFCAGLAIFSFMEWRIHNADGR
jgi:hypothetical protein